MMARLDDLKGYKYYFQFTINGYSRSYEPNLPSLEERVATFLQLSETIGRDKVIWRYDPVLLSRDVGVEDHIRIFKQLADALHEHTFRCIISFIDLYKKTEKNTKSNGVQLFTDETMRFIAKEFSAIAHHYSLNIHTCAERIDLQEYGITHGKCIDDDLISRLISRPYSAPKDKNQREECGCIKSIDIGSYNTCGHLCTYCYANFSPERVRASLPLHDEQSPLLIGQLSPDDKVTERNSIDQLPLKFEM
jgi:DNA repair photolyase